MNLAHWIDSATSYLPTAFHRPYLHFTAICLLFFLFALLFLISRLRLLFDQLRRKWNPPAPYQPQLLVYYRNSLIWWCFVLLIGVALMAMAIYLSHYQHVGEGVAVAGNAIHHGDTVRYTNYSGAQMEFRTRGTQVASAGLFFRFPKWMRVLGLNSYHRLVTFRGNGENQYHYARPGAEWIKSYADPIYTFLYKHQWLDAHYTESVYFPPGKHQILVTHSGYIVR